MERGLLSLSRRYGTYRTNVSAHLFRDDVVYWPATRYGPTPPSRCQRSEYTASYCSKHSSMTFWRSSETELSAQHTDVVLMSATNAIQTKLGATALRHATHHLEKTTTDHLDASNAAGNSPPAAAHPARYHSALVNLDAKILSFLRRGFDTKHEPVAERALMAAGYALQQH